MKRAGAAVALLVIACRSYSPPALQELYRTDLGWSGHDQDPPRPSDAHWERIARQGHLTLADGFAVALSRSERIARAAEAYLQSTTLHDRALAAFLPTVGLQATQFLQEDVGTIGGSPVSTSPERREFRATLSQPLFRGLRDFAAWRQAQALIDQRRSFFDTERRLLFLLFAESFFNALILERQVNVLEDSLKNTRHRLREMQARRDQGIARKTEVLLIETQVASDETLLSRAKLALDLARTQLAFLLGRPLELPLRDEPGDAPIPPDVAPLIEEALRTRSELKEREAAVRAAEENARVIWGEHLPNLDLTGNYYIHRENFSTFQQRTDWDLLFTATFNLFKGGDIRARTVEAESQLRSARLSLQETRRQIDAEVRDSLASLRSGEELVRILEARDRTASENYRQIVEEYRQGIAGVSNLEVLVAQNQQLSAQLELERQRFLRRLNWFQLQVSIGQLPVRIP